MALGALGRDETTEGRAKGVFSNPANHSQSDPVQMDTTKLAAAVDAGSFADAAGNQRQQHATGHEIKNCFDSQF